LAVGRAASITCESELTNDIDKAFSLLVEWCGQFGVEIIRMFIDPWSERSTGIPTGDEKSYCVVAQDGTSTTVNIEPSVFEDENVKTQSWFAQVSRTVTLPCASTPRTISATASASYLSYISYSHAEEQAGVLANQAANAAAQQYKAQNPC
jgi:hypothetical protein